jgi:apolipoprotein N-acyltransferase
MAYLLMIISAMLIVVPLSIPSLFFLSWISLIPALFVLQGLSSKEGFKKGWLMGITIMCGVSYWLIYPMIDYSGLSIFYILLLIFLLFSLFGIFYGLWAFIFIKLKPYNELLPIYLTFTWVGFEYLRLILFPDLPFGFMAYTQVKFLQLLQFADLGGIFLISSIIIMINGFIFLIIKYKKKRVMNFIILFVIFIIILFYGTYKNFYYNNKEYEELNIGFVQTNIPQAQKWKTENIRKNLDILLEKSSKIKDAELIIWPESALTFDLIRNEYYRNLFLSSVKTLNKYILTGSLSIIDNNQEKYNSSFLVSPEGKIINRYNKIRLVPFGEYMPFNKLIYIFSGINMNSQLPGKELVFFKTGFANWRTAICSEILYPYKLTEGIVETDFIVNPSNEAWFRNSNLQQQMLTAANFRAVENRRTVIKVSNRAFSGVISPDGKINIISPYLNEDIVSTRIKMNDDTTKYQRWGDIAGQFSLIFTIILFLLKIIFRKIIYKFN